jgi:hypothetical protein
MPPSSTLLNFPEVTVVYGKREREQEPFDSKIPHIKRIKMHNTSTEDDR